MNNQEELSGSEAVEKYEQIVKHDPMCMFLTRLNERPIPGRPMTTQKVCDQGNFWFLSSRSSMKDHDIAKDPAVQLIFGNTSRGEFLSVLGDAEIVDDIEKKKELWNPLAKAWFPDGVDDPDLTVLKVTPRDGYYWDTRDGKAVTMLKIMAAAMTGRASDIGIQGHVHV